MTRAKDAALGAARKLPGARLAARRARQLGAIRHEAQGLEFGSRIARRESTAPVAPAANPLLEYFDAHTQGAGIYKPRHYFEVYHRHFARFVGRPVHVVEIGVYSGGSLGMWQSYFGDGCHVYGVDIEEECRRHASDRVDIFIGDQADPGFWRDFRRKVPHVDIVIDDGGHLAHQQIPTLEALLPHLSDGGVYVCEDIGGVDNPFQSYLGGLARNLHSTATAQALTGLQQTVHSVHVYPFIVAIEKPDQRFGQWSVDYRGSDWAAFGLPCQTGDRPLPPRG